MRGASIPPVHLITDRALAADLPARVREASRGLPRGRIAFHLREKDLGGRALLALARALRRACDEAGQLLVVNDRLDVAVAAGADGVPLPAAGIPAAEARRLLGPGALVGSSCHSRADVEAALAGGASYATFSPIYDTPSKRPYGPPVGVEALRDAVAVGLPLVALGGIDAVTAPEVRAAGAAGVAAIRAWLVGEDPAAAVRALAGPEAASRRRP
ncbi:MAG TPA: thiamine phosphate synthase [Anaeromyxobacteraceae bacterium]|nr:thiamine phosphate synthase [Anaeromyxobacteraceae bacterium]